MEIATRAELITLLGSRHALDRAVHERAWTQVVRGAYVRGGDPTDLHVRARAAQAVLPADSWAADRFLLWLLGIDVLPHGPVVVEAAVPRLAVVPQRTGMKLRECAVPQHDQVIRDGLRILRPMRAVADLLRLLPDAERLVVADAVLRDGASRDSLRTELASHASLRGVRLAHAALDLADGRAESPPESRLRHCLLKAGIVSVPQYDVIGPNGSWVARVDLALVELRIAIEYDGRDVHERADVFVRDRRRQNALVSAGWTVLRFTAEDLRSPEQVVAMVQRAMLQLAA